MLMNEFINYCVGLLEAIFYMSTATVDNGICKSRSKVRVFPVESVHHWSISLEQYFEQLQSQHLKFLCNNDYNKSITLTSCKH